jgi:murein DD-endopeptidase MepM/ murein hydrolase activator NlpD
MAISLAPAFDETEEERKRKHPATLTEALARMAPAAPDLAPAPTIAPTLAPQPQPAPLTQQLATSGNIPQQPEPELPLPLPPWASAPPEFFGEPARLPQGEPDAGVDDFTEMFGRTIPPAPAVMPDNNGEPVGDIARGEFNSVAPAPMPTQSDWRQNIPGEPMQQRISTNPKPAPAPKAPSTAPRRPFEGDYGVSTKYGEKGSIWRMGYHPGTDYATPMNTPAVATEDGVIERVGRDENYGNYVWVRHPWGTAIYGHLNSTNVQAGDKVKAGAVLGKTGTTGKSTGPHLHFETRVNGQIVDPATVGHGHHEGDGHDHDGTEMTALSVRGQPVINEAQPPVDLPPGGMTAPPTYPDGPNVQTNMPTAVPAPAPSAADFSGLMDNPIVRGVGAAADAFGRMPIASVIPMPRFPQDPTFGDLGGAVMEGFQAAGELGGGLMQAAGVGFPGAPGSGAPRTPEDIGRIARSSIATGIARRAPKDPMAFIQAAVEAVREFQQTRPETFPGDRLISEALFDASNLLPGIGIGDDLIQAIAPIVKRSVGGVTNAAQTALPSLERAGMQLAGMNPQGIRTSETMGANLGNAFEAIMRRNDAEVDRLNRQVQTAFTQGKEDDAIRLLGQVEKLSERNETLKAIAGRSDEIQAEIGALEAAASELPGGNLVGLIAKSGEFKGEIPETLTLKQYQDMTGRATPAAGNIRGGRVPFHVVLDQAADELGMTEDELKGSIEQVLKFRQRAEDLKQDLRLLDDEARKMDPSGGTSWFAGATRATPMDAPATAQQPLPLDPTRPEPPMVPRDTAPAPAGGQRPAQERGFAASVRKAPDTPVTMREALEADPGAYYDPISNTASRTAAEEMINTDPQAARALIMQSAEAPDATTSTVAQLLVKQAQLAGNEDEALDLTIALAERATKAGQFIQALGMYSRLTPEGIRRLAVRTVKQAQEAGIKVKDLTPEKSRQLVEQSTLIQSLKTVDAEELAPLRAAVQAAEAERDHAVALAKQLREQIAKGRQATQAARAKAKPKLATDFAREMREFFGAPTSKPGAARVGRTNPLEYFSSEEQADYRAWAEAIKGIADEAQQMEARTAFFADLNAAVDARKAAVRAEAAKVMTPEQADEEMRRLARGEVREARGEVQTQRRTSREAETAQRQASRAELNPVEQQARQQEAARLRALEQEQRQAQAAAKREADAFAALANQKATTIKRAEEALAKQKADSYERAIKALERQKTESYDRALNALERQKAEAPAKDAAAVAKAEEKRLERLAHDMEYLTNASVRETKQRAVNVDRAVITKLKAQAKAAGIVLPDKLAEDVLRRAASGPAGREEAILTAEMLRNVAELVPASRGRKVATVQTIAQLLNPKTTIRNVFGNALFVPLENATRLLATGIDIPLSVATGKRSVAAPNIGAQLRGGIRGAREGFEETKRGVDLINAPTQYELPQGRTFRDTPVLAGLEKGLNYTLRVPDRAFYQGAYDDALLSSAWLQARNEGLRGEALGRRQTELVFNPTNDMIQEAQAAALFRTFQNDSRAAQLFSAFKQKVLNAGYDFGPGDFVLKYAKTPANLMMAAMKYSPFGLLETVNAIRNAAFKNGKNNQRAFVESVARATIGTAGLGGTGYVLSSYGLMTARPSNDPDVRAQMQALGIRPYSFNWDGIKRWMADGFSEESAKPRPGDTWVSYDWAQPMAVTMAMGAQLAKPEKKVKKVGPQSDGGIMAQLVEYGELPWEVFTVGVDTIAEQPMLEGIRRVFGGRNPTESLVNVLQDAPASFVPTVLSQVNALYDNNPRAVYDPNPFKEALNGVLAKIPIAAQTYLPESADVWGDDRDRYHNDTNNLFNVFVNPSFMGEYFPQPEAEMLLALQEATGEVSQFPRVAPKEIKVTGEDGKEVPYVLSAEQWQEYQRELGTLTRDSFAALAGSDKFQKGTEAEQIDFLSKVLTVVNTEAKNILRDRYQQADGGYTQLPPPEKKKVGGQETLTSRNAVEYHAAQKLLAEYDNIPKKLLEGPRGAAYQAAIDAVNAAPPGSIQREIAASKPAYQIYNELVDREREKMRRTNKELEKAGRRFKGWNPLR